MNKEGKPIRLSGHAQRQTTHRGTTEIDVIKAIRSFNWTEAGSGRMECRLNLPFYKEWNGTVYATQQIRPIFVEEENEIVVVTVYVYYF